MDALPVSFLIDVFVGDFVLGLPARCLLGSGVVGSVRIRRGEFSYDEKAENRHRFRD
jgi:hypothetical protein